MATQKEFNQHVEKINDIKGQAVEIRGNNVRWVGLTREEGAELEKLEATLPDLLKEDWGLFLRVVQGGKTMTEERKEIIEKDAGLTPSELELVNAWRKNNKDSDSHFKIVFREKDGENYCEWKLEERKGADPQAMRELAQAEFCKTAGISDFKVASQLVTETAISIAHKSSKEDISRELAERINLVLKLLMEMKPQDPFEAMLACRMIALHFTGINALCKSSLSTTTEDANQFTARASKLFKLWNEAKDRLDRHRRKEDQKVVVEHVHVGAGGQAIVGNVTHKGGGV